MAGSLPLLGASSTRWRRSAASRRVERRLRQCACVPAPSSSGSGRASPQEVWVTTSGFMHQGQAYASLSEVARAITGTRWNGPLFFGLRDKMKEAA